MFPDNSNSNSISRALSKSTDKSISRSVDPDASPPRHEITKMNISPLGSLGTGGSMSSFATTASRPRSGAEAKRRPWEQKETVRCMFCRGAKCKRCGKDAFRLCENSPIKKIHANWITDDILAMQRPSDEHFVRHKFVEQLKDLNIVAVFNLQEPGEHPFCGYGIKESGFSYYPEKLMAAGIKFFNYSWKDMTTPPIAMMMDIVRIALNEITNGGKVAVHCHAGFGRTGIVIASIMMAQHRLEAENTISIIREKRPGSVQTTQQQVFVYEFKTAYTLMEEFYPPCTFGGNGPCLDKNLVSTLKTIKVSENDQHYCLSPDEAVDYAKCPKPVALAIDLLKSASVLSAALTSCFIIGLHPNLIVKGDSFNPTSPLYMPPLEPEILLPKHGSQVNIPNYKAAAADTSTLPSVIATQPGPTNRSVSMSVDSGLAGITELHGSGASGSNLQSKTLKPNIVKSLREHKLAYRVAHAKQGMSTVDWISEEKLELFKNEANLGNWSLWIPPTTSLARSTPVQAAQHNLGITRLSESIESIQKTPRHTPRVIPQTVSKPSSPFQSSTPTKYSLDTLLKEADDDKIDSADSSPDKLAAIFGATLENQPTSLNYLPPLHVSPFENLEPAQSHKRRLSNGSFGGSMSNLPRLVEGSPMKPSDSASALPLLVSCPSGLLCAGKAKSFSSLQDVDKTLSIKPQIKVGDDHISEAIVKEELEAREKLQNLRISAKRRNSKSDMLADIDGGDSDQLKRKKSLNEMHFHSAAHLNNSASGYLEMVQALGNNNATGEKLEHESHFFLGGILLVDWLESRADPLIDDNVLEMLSDAWCKSISVKEPPRKSMSALGHQLQSTPCETLVEVGGIAGKSVVTLANQGKSSSLLGSLVDSLSPDPPKSGKRSSKSRKLPPKLGRGSTYASFGVEGEPVTPKILDDLLKKHMPK